MRFEERNIRLFRTIRSFQPIGFALTCDTDDRTGRGTARDRFQHDVEHFGAFSLLAPDRFRIPGRSKSMLLGSIAFGAFMKARRSRADRHARLRIFWLMRRDFAWVLIARAGLANYPGCL